MAKGGRASWSSRISSLVRPFGAPRASFGDLDADAAATLIASAADVTLILDKDGVIRDLAIQSEELSQALDGWAGWLGKSWADVINVDSRGKVADLLAGDNAASSPRWRHVNHRLADGSSVPILYSVSPAGEDRFVAFGRDLRAMSALQQRLVNAQESMERDYSRLQHVETRYRLLFQTSPEAVLVVDANTRRVNEANPAATPLFGAARVVGRPFVELFETASVGAVESLLSTVRTGGRADDVRAKLSDAREVTISAMLFRHDEASLYLVRLTPVLVDGAVVSKLKGKLLKLIEGAPDAFVVTDQAALVVTANAAFVELVQLGSEDQVRGESLERWLGRPGVDLDVLTANLRQRGQVRLFSTVIRAEYGTSAEVEVSAVTVMNGGEPCYGFAIRNVGRRLTVEPHPSTVKRELPRSVEQLTELIGRVSLKDLVREATDVIERLAIEAALDLTGDNRASAAEMLGLSRQSLYVKLRRYGMGDLAEDKG